MTGRAGAIAGVADMKALRCGDAPEGVVGRSFFRVTAKVLDSSAAAPGAKRGNVKTLTGGEKPLLVR
jgi:hypothetical protein